MSDITLSCDSSNYPTLYRAHMSETSMMPPSARSSPMENPTIEVERVIRVGDIPQESIRSISLRQIDDKELFVIEVEDNSQHRRLCLKVDELDPDEVIQLQLLSCEFSMQKMQEKIERVLARVGPTMVQNTPAPTSPLEVEEMTQINDIVIEKIKSIFYSTVDDETACLIDIEDEFVPLRRLCIKLSRISSRDISRLKLFYCRHSIQKLHEKVNQTLERMNPSATHSTPPITEEPPIQETPEESNLYSKIIEIFLSPFHLIYDFLKSIFRCLFPQNQ
jgi:hypothetical protein